MFQKKRNVDQFKLRSYDESSPMKETKKRIAYLLFTFEVVTQMFGKLHNLHHLHHLG